MPIRIAALLLSSLFLLTGLAADTPAPRLLLTAQRLRRLKREYERHSDRWVNFETRVKGVPDSSERGFELALYFAITGDAARGREAVSWAHDHPCEQRQVALIRDWVGDSDANPQVAKSEAQGACNVSGQISPKRARDDLFTAISSGESFGSKPLELASFEDEVLNSPEQLYALCEYLIALRDTDRTDVREQAAQFFLELPAEFLLSRTPEMVEHPDWMTHTAALALVALDPNLQASQFVQSWVLEQRQTIQEGPGVGYELLWADPYLPGVGYQNLDLWVYDDTGRLFARTTWDSDACWVAISPSGVKEEHCPADWKQKTSVFGHLTLIPLTAGCVQVAAAQNNGAAILWQMQPKQNVAFNAQHGRTLTADVAGMLRVGPNLAGKACLAKAAKR